MRAGPGLGGILPSQGDYWQATKGGGHGDYHCLTLAPWSVQEAADLVQDAFELADYYRNPTFVLADGIIGQMMEPCEFKDRGAPLRALPPKDWAAIGNTPGRRRAIITSLYLDPDTLEQRSRDQSAKYQAMARDDTRMAVYDDGCESGCDLLLVAYGTVARVCSSAREQLRELGLRVALARPITLFPFPSAQIREAAEKASRVLVVELSAGQMLEDVRLAVAERRPVDFYGRMGGNVVFPDEIVAHVSHLLGQASLSAKPRPAPEALHVG
jgi:2-oxoglutarate ferredoxin oxidoreductase subunit alpha